PEFDSILPKMKTMKGKFLKKLKSIRPIGYLKPERILQVSASHGFMESFSPNSDYKSDAELCNKEEEQEQEQKNVESTQTDQDLDIIDVAELMKDLEEEEEEEEEVEIDDLMDNKENIGPISMKKDPIQESTEKSKSSENGFWRNRGFEALKPPEKKSKSEKVHQIPLSEIDISSFRRPDLNSRTLFDPSLLEAFRQAVMEHMLNEETENTIHFRIDTRRHRIHNAYGIVLHLKS
ncbi:hypothetical protein RJ641_005225, partial [Dillenia turbinata]